MKYFVGVLMSMGFLGFWYTTPLNNISAVEAQTTIAVDDLYLINYYQDLIKTVESSCPASEIEIAKPIATEIITKLDTLYETYSASQQLNKSLHLHDSLAALQLDGVENISNMHYCALKYILYTAQSRARDIHLRVMTDTGIIKDFERFAPGWPIHGYDVKEELMKTYIAELEWYKKLLWVELEFQKWKQIAGIDYPSIDLMKLSDQLMQLTVYKALYMLRDRWLFVDTDIAQLQNKIKLDMQLSCGTFHGNYSLTENFINWVHESFEVQSIPLNVNVCGNYFLLQELPTHYLKIVIHELAHHYYYFHDDAVSNTFENICRDQFDNKRGRCTLEDFVTEYAQSEPAEDYAEHFMYRFLDLLPLDPSPILTQKIQYFEVRR